MLPSKTWASYANDIKAIGEHRRSVDTSDGFLRSLELIDDLDQLTDSGSHLFTALWVTTDQQKVQEVMHASLLKNAAVLAICQTLFGIAAAAKSNADSALRSQGFGDGLTDRKLGTLLTIMANFDLIQYVKGAIHVFDSPFEEAQGLVPAAVFISRETPYSNLLWLTRVLRECTGHIYWLDKHFQPGGLEALADAADGSRVSKVHILSLQLDQNSNSKAKKKYQALQQELKGKGIDLEWRFIDSTLVRGTHDRWIIGDSSARNVPDVGTILSGSHSEISKSGAHARLNVEFENYWSQGTLF